MASSSSGHNNNNNNNNNNRPSIDAETQPFLLSSTSPQVMNIEKDHDSSIDNNDDDNYNYNNNNNNREKGEKEIKEEEDNYEEDDEPIIEDEDDEEEEEEDDDDDDDDKEDGNGNGNGNDEKIDKELSDNINTPIILDERNELKIEDMPEVTHPSHLQPPSSQQSTGTQSSSSQFEPNDTTNEIFVAVEEKLSVEFFCKVALFLYAFLCGLIMSWGYSHSAGWFQFLMFMNIMACIVGIIGCYLKFDKLLIGCMAALSIVLLSNLLAVVVFLFGRGEGTLYDEAESRCSIMESAAFYGPITHCKYKVRTQLFWEICFVLAIYIIVSVVVIVLTYYTYQKMKPLPVAVETQSEKPRERGSISIINNLKNINNKRRKDSKEIYPQMENQLLSKKDSAAREQHKKKSD